MKKNPNNRAVLGGETVTRAQEAPAGGSTAQENGTDGTNRTDGEGQPPEPEPEPEPEPALIKVRVKSQPLNEGGVHRAKGDVFEVTAERAHGLSALVEIVE